VKAQRDDDNVSKVCKYRAAGVQRGERAEGERRAGVNHVSASARQGNMPRPFKRDTRANSLEPLVSTGKVFPQWLVSRFRDMADGTKDFSGEKEEQPPSLATCMMEMPSMVVSVKRAMRRFTSQDATSSNSQPKVEVPQTTGHARCLRVSTS
jgi:hypothetical protein